MLRWVEGVTRYEKASLSRENGVAELSLHPDQEDTFSMPSLHGPDRLAVAFDDGHALANAGLLLPATLAEGRNTPMA